MGASELLIVLLFVGPFLLFPLWAVVDILQVPTSRFEAAGKSKGGWLALLLVSLFLSFGWLTALIYIASVRSAVRGAQPEAV